MRLGTVRVGSAVLAGLIALIVVLAVTAGSTEPEESGTVACTEQSERSAGVRCAGDDPLARLGVPEPGGRAPSPRDGESVETASGAVALRPVSDPDRPAVILDITEPSPSLPNPFVTTVDGEYLMFTTEARDAIGAKQNVPVLRSTDLETWHFVRDALPEVGAWAVPEATWAPDAIPVGEGWVLYYTARLAAHDPETQCIGVATSRKSIGPYDPAPQPLVCQLERGGSIDPRAFRDADGSLWLHWKSDDNSDVEGTSTSTIYAQRLSDDGAAVVDEPVRMLEVTQPWEGRIVEAPDLVEADGRLWLFYSANWFNQAAYAIGVAVCDTPAGPCSKPFDGPWLASNAQGEGPGEASLFQDLTGTWRMVYSPVAQQFRIETDRPIAMATVGFDAAGPYLAEPVRSLSDEHQE